MYYFTNLGSQSTSTEVSDHNRKVSTTFGSTITGGDYSSTTLKIGMYINMIGFAKRVLYAQSLIFRNMFLKYSIHYISGLHKAACVHSPLIYGHPRPFSGWTLQWISS